MSQEHRLWSDRLQSDSPNQTDTLSTLSYKKSATVVVDRC